MRYVNYYPMGEEFYGRHLREDDVPREEYGGKIGTMIADGETGHVFVVLDEIPIRQGQIALGHYAYRTRVGDMLVLAFDAEGNAMWQRGIERRHDFHQKFEMERSFSMHATGRNTLQLLYQNEEGLALTELVCATGEVYSGREDYLELVQYGSTIHLPSLTRTMTDDVVICVVQLGYTTDKARLYLLDMYPVKVAPEVEPDGSYPE